MLRIGELTLSEHTIKAKDVHSAKNKDKVLLILRSSKTHTTRQRHKEITIKRPNRKKEGVTRFCPVELIIEYTEIRPPYENDNDPIFVFTDNSPLKSTHVRKTLRTALSNMSLIASNYDTHSFRIGRAIDLSKWGSTIEYIKKTGRWTSNAVYKYLR